MFALEYLKLSSSNFVIDIDRILPLRQAFKQKKSFVWKYFTRFGDKAQCQVQNCDAWLGAKSTTSLNYHLEKRHNIFKSEAGSAAR